MVYMLSVMFVWFCILGSEQLLHHEAMDVPRSQEVSLYGGALSAELPRSYTDASTFREVPDHQEAWVDTTSDRSIIIEILEQKDVNDAEAIDFFLSDLAAFNEATESKVMHSRPLEPEEVSNLPTCRAFTGVGQQVVAKFREDHSGPVQIHCAVLRLPDVTTDILITLNDPHALHQSDPPDVLPAEVTSEVIFARLLKSFRILDWTLFGEWRIDVPRKMDLKSWWPMEPEMNFLKGGKSGSTKSLQEFVQSWSDFQPMYSGEDCISSSKRKENHCIVDG